MQVLHYETPRRPTFDPRSALVLAPFIGGLATLIAVGHRALRAPFGAFKISDAVIQIGSPLLAAGLWVYWSVLASRRRLRLRALVPSLIWSALHLWSALWLGIAYFHEPWNH